MKTFLFDEVNLGGPTPNIQISLNGICTDGEAVELPVFYENGSFCQMVRYIGYKEVKAEDTRSEYERWKDEYYYNYYPTPTLIEIEVSVSKSVKKILIPYSIEKISKRAFKGLTQVEFVIDEQNYNYKVCDGKIVNKHTGEVLWPCEE